jgi:hypothetical protein
MANAKTGKNIICEYCKVGFYVPRYRANTARFCCHTCCSKVVIGNYKKHKVSGLAGLNILYNHYKQGAKKRKLDFQLNLDQFKTLTQNKCNYCEIDPKQKSQSSDLNVVDETKAFGMYIYNGIDRVDSNKGYIFENCVSCCKICNRAKWDTPKEEFIAWLKRVGKLWAV